ncbi:hypothetical protein HKX48_002474 [Thoreauomyces humboldtii]|nr:hypothetical protein HKX48_002474 [Thoreauomyces humboldtii]
MKRTRSTTEIEGEPRPRRTETESSVGNPGHDDEENADPFYDEEDEDLFNDDEENDSPVDNQAHDGDRFYDNSYDDEAEQRRLNDLLLEEEQRAAWFDDFLPHSDDGLQFDYPYGGLEECESLSFSSALYRIS